MALISSRCGSMGLKIRQMIRITQVMAGIPELVSVDPHL